MAAQTQTTQKNIRELGHDLRINVTQVGFDCYNPRFLSDDGFATYIFNVRGKESNKDVFKRLVEYMQLTHGPCLVTEKIYTWRRETFVANVSCNLQNDDDVICVEVSNTAIKRR